MVKKIYSFVFAVSFFFLFSNEKISAQLYWNQACTFAGSNSSYVAVRNSSTLNITGSFTIEAWVNPANATSPSFQIILQKRAAGANGYTLYLSGGRVAIRTNSSTRLTGNTLVPSNQWTHTAGTYNSSTNTFRTYVNGSLDSSVVQGYSIVDSGKAYVSVNGFAQLNLLNVSAGSGFYFLHLKHRNSIETWSYTSIFLDPLTFQGQYDFTDAASKAFGDNMTNVDNTPVKFAIYNGDVNQDRSVDLTDLTLIENAAFNFEAGYILTDLNGDNAADLADLAIADNNAFNFVQAILPPFAPEIMKAEINHNFSDPALDY